MPKIRQIEQRTQAPGPVSQPRMPYDLGAGSGLVAIGAKLQEYQEKRDIWDADLRAAEMENEYIRIHEEAKRSAPPGAEGFTEQSRERFSSYLESNEGTIPNNAEAQKRFSLRMSKLQGRLEADSMSFEARSYSRFQTDRLKTQLVEIENLANISSPDDLSSLLAKAEDLIASAPFWDEQTRAQMLISAKTSIYDRNLSGAVRDLINREGITPSEIEDSLSRLKNGDGGYLANSSPDEFEAAVNRLQKAKDLVGSYSRETASNAVADALAAIEVNGPSSANIEGAMEKTRAAYPDDPERVARVAERLNTAVRVYSAGQEMALTSPEEDAAKLNSLKEKVGGEYAALEAGEYQVFRKALALKREELSEDRVSYITRNSDRVQAKIVAASESPPEARADAMRSLFTEMDSVYSRMGIMPEDRQYLGKSQADRLVAELGGMSANDAADRLASLYSDYQGVWPSVIDELRTAKLDPAYSVVARLSGPEHIEARLQLVAAAQAGAGDLRKQIGATATDIDSEVVRVMQPLANTLVTADRLGLNALSAESEAVRLRAYFLAAKGMDYSDAVETAYESQIGSDYDFDGETFVAPKGMGALAVSTAEDFIDNLSPYDIQPLKWAPGMPQRFKEDEAFLRQRTWQLIQDQAHWVNTPMEDGIMLMRPSDMGGTGYTPVFREDGSRIIILFDEMGE